MIKKSERVSPEKYRSNTERLIYFRHLFAYKYAYNLIKKNAAILDLGCGEGYGTKLLSDKAKVVGIDVDKNTIVEANNKYKSPNCYFKLYRGNTLPFNNNSFDSIISFQTIEHIENDLKFVAEAFRVLKRGGDLLITTPNKTFRLKPGQIPFNKYHIREYDEKELRLVLETKFTNVKILGIKGNTDIQNIERKRIKKINTLVRLDFLNIRNRLPETAIFQLKQIVGMTNNEKVSNDQPHYNSGRISASSFYTTRHATRQSLDLLAICLK